MHMGVRSQPQFSADDSAVTTIVQLRLKVIPLQTTPQSSSHNHLVQITVQLTDDLPPTPEISKHRMLDYDRELVAMLKIASQFL